MILFWLLIIFEIVLVVKWLASKNRAKNMMTLLWEFSRNGIPEVRSARKRARNVRSNYNNDRRKVAAPLKLALFIFGMLLLTACTDSDDKRKQEENGQEGNGMMGRKGMDMMDRDGQKMMSENQWMMGDPEMMGDMSKMMKDMQIIHQLLINHNQIQRRVENLPNGIESWTESEDSEIAQAIKNHVNSMSQRVEEGRSIRHMDPLFGEIFEHHDAIQIQIEETAKGVYVIETSKDPNVVKLIQQHAHRAVNEFVEEGMQRAMQPTPLPETYEED